MKTLLNEYGFELVRPVRTYITATSVVSKRDQRSFTRGGIHLTGYQIVTNA